MLTPKFVWPNATERPINSTPIAIYKSQQNQMVASGNTDNFLGDLKHSLENMTSHWWDRAGEEFENNSTLAGYQPVEREERLEFLMWILLTIALIVAGK